MTALKPIENFNVRSVASESYPLNAVCAHPECSEATNDPHHIFPRSQIGGTSWFVEITGLWSELDPNYTLRKPGSASEIPTGLVIPHVTGLCREHHNEVEAHVAWIKLEDGVFVWYAREGDTFGEGEFVLVGPLNPQPGSREGKTKRGRKKFEGDERRKRRTISLRVPDDTEDGGAVYDDALDRVKARLVAEGLYDEGSKIPAFEATIAAWNDWLNST